MSLVNPGTKQPGRPALLLLGSSGFIGRHLARATQDDLRFGSLELVGKSPDVELSGIRGLACTDLDASVLSQCRAPDVVVWAMGGASVGASVIDPDADRRRSIPPLEALLQRMARDWPASRLVFISSAAVYGRFGSASTAVETPLEAVSPYGEHKIASERLIADSLPADRFTIIRPFSVYGPGLRRQLLWDALEKLKAGDLSFFGYGDELRDWVHVSDLVGLLTDISLGPQAFPRVLNAGTGTGTSVSRTLHALFRAAGSHAEPSFAQVRRSGDPQHLVADREQQLRYAPYFPTDLRTGLADYVAWHRQQQ